jgi:hypothetical protein
VEHHPDFMSRRDVRRFVRWLPRDPTGYGTPDPDVDYIWYAEVGQGWTVTYVVHPFGVIFVTGIEPTARG